MNHKKLIITIDGPAAAGKGTAAFLLSRRYNLTNLDSGALFRAVTWLALHEDVPLDDRHQHQIVTLAQQHHVQLVPGGELSGQIGAEVDGKTISREIRSEELGRLVPKVSALAEVRQLVLEWQRDIAKRVERGVVVEGRDTGTMVFPLATVKFFLTASPEERAARRHAELIEKGKTVTFEEVYTDLIARDQADIERTLSPLTRPSDALVIDSTGLAVEDVLERMGRRIETVAGKEWRVSE